MGPTNCLMGKSGIVFAVSTGFHRSLTKQNQSLPANDLVLNSTFNARNSKPDCLLAGTNMNVIISRSLEVRWKDRECLC